MVPRNRTSRQSTVVLGLAVFFLGAGLGLLLALVVSDGWPTFDFAILIGVGIVLLAAGLWARRGPETWARRNVAYLAVAALSAGVLVWIVGVGQVERKTFVMTWELGAERSSRFPGQQEVVLRFRDWPGCRLEFFSRELADFLTRQASPTVELELEITKDFGEVRGFGIRRVGPFVRRSFGWSNTGCRGECPGAQREGRRPAPAANEQVTRRPGESGTLIDRHCTSVDPESRDLTFGGSAGP